ncbi:amidohydrolase [Salinibacterium sp. NK8237]|uniref:amidohydrolase n=1 Tax=Salinibacterium sp. NK8237 TaxID=2792038 RepID=UPI0018CD49D5|nr:amidohydrolase [Salinibacterium sp. NK8237]MBH0130497.1 amidohydrolase [Salinibacterium sp. NK8237]
MSSTLFVGTVLTLNENVPRASAVLVEGDRITAVGAESDLRSQLPADATIVELGERVLMPGLIEPHGHPTSSAVLLSENVVDIRPVIVTDPHEVMHRIRSAVGAEPAGVLANGWDPLLQVGLVDPTLTSLDELAGDVPLVIVHNSGHSAFFNSAAAALAGITRETPDPQGSSYGRDDKGELSGVAHETAAIFTVAGPFLSKSYADFDRLMSAELHRANAVGVTTLCDMSWNPAQAPLLAAARDQHEFTARLRLYEMSHPGGTSAIERVNGDHVVSQIGIKTWADGSPWVGNIATSFPYLTNATTTAMGLEPGHRGTANFSEDELREISRNYAAQGWQLACHAHGDLAIDSVLNAWETVITELGLTDHRFRLEHVGAITPAQCERAATLGVTVSVFVDHIHYWGDVLVDKLFGEPGMRWADAQSALAAGIRTTFHNDGTVTPLEPFRNMAVAMTRRSNTGRVLDGAKGVTLDDALRAHTTSAAWQLQSENHIGSIEVGKYADLIVIDRDPYEVSSEALANTQVLATYFAGALVYENN